MSLVPESERTSNNGCREGKPGITQAMKRKLEEKEEIVNDSKKWLYGLTRKSLFSQTARKEIETLNLSEEDKLVFRRYRLRRLAEYMRNKRQYHEGNILRAEKTCTCQHILSREDNDIFKKFFEHQESCKDEAPCDLEACSEIKEILTCFEKCKADQKFDCLFCDVEVEDDLWWVKNDKLKKKQRLIYFEKRFKLIKDYSNMIEGSDRDTDNLFSASCTLLGVFSDEEKNKKLLLKLLCILHVQICLEIETETFFKDREVCDYPNCKQLKGVVKHLYETQLCSREELCTLENCSEVKELMRHWEDCAEKNNFQCTFCGNYLSKYRTLLKKIKKIEAKIDEELDKERKQLRTYTSEKWGASVTLKKFFLNS